MEEEGGCGGNQPAAAAAEQISLLPEVVIENNDDQMEIASWLGRQELESWRKVVKDRIWIKTTMDQARRHGKDVKWVINEFERALYWMVSKGEGKKSPKLFLRNWIDRELGEGKYGTPKQGRSGSRQRTTYIPAKPEPGKYDGIGKVYSEFEGEGAIPRPKGYEEP